MAGANQGLKSEEQAYCDALEEENEELRERILQLEKELGMHIEVPLMFDITASEARVLGALLERDLVTKETGMLALYSDKPLDSEVEIKIVDVFICKLRRKLKKWDVEILTAWGRGYYLDEENKAKVRAYLPKPAVLAAE